VPVVTDPTATPTLGASSPIIPASPTASDAPSPVSSASPAAAPPPLVPALPVDRTAPPGSFNAPATYTDADRVAASLDHAAAVGFGGTMAGYPGYGAMPGGFPGYGYYPGYPGYPMPAQMLGSPSAPIPSLPLLGYGSSPTPPPSPYSSMPRPLPVPAPTLQQGAFPVHGLPPVVNIASSISIKLTSDNYLFWRAQVGPLLRSHLLMGYVDGTITCPSPHIVVPHAGSMHHVPNLAHQHWTQ
jgi:hypothetical protein